MTGTIDGVVARYGDDGTRKWLHQFGGIQQTRPESIGVDSSDNIYVGGHHDLADSNGGYYKAMLCIKFAPAGTVTWSKTFASSAEEYVVNHDIFVSPDGTVVAAGRTDGTIGGQTVVGDSDSYVSKVAEGGEWQIP